MSWWSNFLTKAKSDAETFEGQGLVVLRNAVHSEALKLAVAELMLIRHNSFLLRNLDPNEPGIFLGDDLVASSFSFYGAPCFEAMLSMLQPVVERVVGKSLGPTYSYARIYYQGAHVANHRDRHACEYSVTLCVQEDSEAWPLVFRSGVAGGRPVYLCAGDICIYRGIDVEHWREKFTGTQHIQAFLHYVDRNGPCKTSIFDGRQSIGMPPIFQRDERVVI